MAQTDAKRELTHLIGLYKRHIIGAAAGRRRTGSMLSYALGASDSVVSEDDQEIAIASMLPAWAPRSPRYVRRKRQRGWGNSFVERKGASAAN